MIDHILLPVDDSACARRAARYGLELAARYDASAEIIHVHDGDEASGRELLDSIAESFADAGPTVETELIRGSPDETIAKRATEAGADLIVMGREGRTGVKERLLGSVTERVLRRADVPVLTVPPGDIDDDVGFAFDDVLLTTDKSDIAERAVPHAVDLARRLGATLHVLTVVDVQAESGVFDAGGVDEEYVERLESEGRETVDRLAERIDDDVDLRTAVVRGIAHEGIEEYVADNGIDLVVMSSEGESNLADQRLGSVTGKVLDTVDVPVFVVTIQD